MARIRFKKPKIAVLMSEVIGLTIWLFLGDRVISVLDQIVGNEYTLNLSGTGANTAVEGCVNGTIFNDAYDILGIGYDCSIYVEDTTSLADMHNADDGLLGVIGLVMVVMVLMNFISYN